MRGALLFTAVLCSACQSTKSASVPASPADVSPVFSDKPEDRIDEIVSRMNGWRIDPVDKEPRMVLMPFADYRLLIEQARDQRNWARTLEGRVKGVTRREPGLDR